MEVGTVSAGEWSKCGWLEPLQQQYGHVCLLCNGGGDSLGVEQVWRRKGCTSIHGRIFLNALRPNICSPALVASSLLSTQF